MATDKKPVCPACGGTGQVNFFKGESRFLLSEEECPNCCGLGYLLEERPDKSSTTSKKNRQKKG
jgi:DnaJ-class molecular chaperone